MQAQIDDQQARVRREGHGSSAAVDDNARESSNTPPESSALDATAQFLKENWLAVLGISAAVLAPCLWHKRIEAGDLASHTYNAWLSQLIERGQAPGLWLASQWNNILFDVSLSRLGNIFGLNLAEKICVSSAVLLFFWGAFALTSAFTRRAPWALIPCIAMFAYGWTFQQGFLNFYISVGLAFFGVALLHRGKGFERALSLAILPFAWMAHPLGAALLVGLGFYVVIAAKLKARQQLMLVVGAGILMGIASAYVTSQYSVVWSDKGFLQTFWTFNGADQLLLYGARYRLPSYLLIAFALTCLALDARMRQKKDEPWSVFFLPLQLYGLALLAGALLPVAVTLPGYGAPLSLLAARLTSVTAVLACCLLGATRPQKWHFPVCAMIAAVFFLFLYSDTAKINKMEQQAERYERVLPQGQRIIATIWPFVGSRLLLNHIVDRACIGHCFSYANYEPSSGQFRVRALPGNPVVMADAAGTDEVQSGNYVVKIQDLPIFEIYQCNLNMTELCMRELAAGDRNGSLGVQPPQQNNPASNEGIPAR